MFDFDCVESRMQIHSENFPSLARVHFFKLLVFFLFFSPRELYMHLQVISTRTKRSIGLWSNAFSKKTIIAVRIRQDLYITINKSIYQSYFIRKNYLRVRAAFVALMYLTHTYIYTKSCDLFFSLTRIVQGTELEFETGREQSATIINIAPSDLRRPLLSLIRGSSMKFKSYNYALARLPLDFSPMGALPVRRCHVARYSLLFFFFPILFPSVQLICDISENLLRCKKIFGIVLYSNNGWAQSTILRTFVFPSVHSKIVSKQKQRWICQKIWESNRGKWFW